MGDLNLSPFFGGPASEDCPIAKHSVAVGKSNELLARTNAAEAEQGRFVLTLGGDHSIVLHSAQLHTTTHTHTHTRTHATHAHTHTTHTHIHTHTHTTHTHTCATSCGTWLLERVWIAHNDTNESLLHLLCIGNRHRCRHSQGSAQCGGHLDGESAV